MIIGTFTKNEDGVFEGEINTLLFSVDVRIEEIEKTGENAPDYRVFRNDNNCEVGAGWKKVSRKNNTYVSTLVDDPSLAQPLWAALTKRDDGGYDLMWSRPRPKTDPDEPGEF